MDEADWAEARHGLNRIPPLNAAGQVTARRAPSLTEPNRRRVLPKWLIQATTTAG
jgi:hypothetical protein